MTIPLEKIVLGLLLVVLLWYRRRFRAPLGTHNILLTMWYREPMLACILYSITCPVIFTWMTCVSLSVAGARLLPLRQLPQRLRRRRRLRPQPQPRQQPQPVQHQDLHLQSAQVRQPDLVL